MESQIWYALIYHIKLAGVVGAAEVAVEVDAAAAVGAIFYNGPNILQKTRGSQNEQRLETKPLKTKKRGEAKTSNDWRRNR
ncbi:hypothetical protein QE152_g12930 [Popillia japonica]|uniref:Uncharacterized protein n=1 Tax=Popillia japonica TaxID=7064 RepID=A0AAW1LES6_POPJA